MRTRKLPTLILLFLSSLVVADAHAGVIQEISFTYNIDFVTAGQVWDVAGVDTSDQIIGTLRYDTMVAGTPFGGFVTNYSQTLNSGFVLNVGSLSFSSSSYDVRITNDAFGIDRLDVFVNDSPSSGAIVLGGPSQFVLGNASGVPFSDTSLPTTLSLSDFNAFFYSLPADNATGDTLFASLDSLSITTAAAVPEPSSCAILGALAVTAAIRRRKPSVSAG